MSKEKTKMHENHVGANCIRPNSTEMTQNKNNNGITLIALIITIIVMLILVAVSVTVALNGGLFDTAQKASNETKIARDEEQMLADGVVNVAGKEYNIMEEYGVKESEARTITFYLGGNVEYTAVAGTTWAQWIVANPSEVFFVDDEGKVCTDAGYLTKNTEQVYASDFIEDEQSYIEEF